MRAMAGKTVLITGANAGIGRETALGLARLGARVIGVSRDRSKGEAAMEYVRRESAGEKVELLCVDLSSMAQVRDLALEVLDRYPRLDVLLHNAGLMQSRRSETGDGFETVFAVNHLAPFLLTRLLLDRLRASAPSRVVVVASRAHGRGRLDVDDLQTVKRTYRGMQVYSASKLANVLFTRELATRLAGSRVTANCLHPGVVRTHFGIDGDTGGVFRILLALARPFFIDAAKGAVTSIHLASSPALAATSGEYFVARRAVEPSPQARDRGLGEALWRHSEELLMPWIDSPSRNSAPP